MYYVGSFFSNLGYSPAIAAKTLNFQGVAGWQEAVVVRNSFKHDIKAFWFVEADGFMTVGTSKVVVMWYKFVS